MILKPPHENNECRDLKKQEVLSKSSYWQNWNLLFVWFSTNMQGLNETLSRQYFPCKLRQCKNYLILMVPCYQYKQNRSANIIIIKIMTMMVLMIIIIVIIIAIMIMIIKMILLTAVVIIINSPFEPDDFSTGSTTEELLFLLI